MRLGLAQVFRLDPVRVTDAIKSSRVLTFAPSASFNGAMIQAATQFGLDGTLLAVPVETLQTVQKQLLRASDEHSSDEQRTLSSNHLGRNTEVAMFDVALTSVPLECTSSLGDILPQSDASAFALGSAMGTEFVTGVESWSLQPSAARHQALEIPDLPGAGNPIAELLLQRRRAQHPELRPLRTDDGALLPSSRGKEFAHMARVKAVFDAARDGDVEALQRLLSVDAVARERQGIQASGNRFVAATHDPDNGSTPLHHLCVSAPVSFEPDLAKDGVALLLRAGAAVNSPAANGATPLHWAAGAGCTQAVVALLAAGADPTARTYTWRRQVFGRGSGQTPAHWAAESNHVNVLRILSEASSTCVLARDERGATPAEVASKSLADASEAYLTELASRRFVLLKVTLESSAGGVIPPSALAVPEALAP